MPAFLMNRDCCRSCPASTVSAWDVLIVALPTCSAADHITYLAVSVPDSSLSWISQKYFHVPATVGTNWKRSFTPNVALRND
jgi:hypothetical protein